MAKYIFLTNIPTPYRTSFYNELAVNNLDFEVYYMRKTEADRNWSIDIGELKHKHYIDRGLYKMFGRYHLHFNPKLIYNLLTKRDIEIVVGGGWNDLNVLALVLLKRIGLLNHTLHFWTEANYLTLGASNDNFVKKLIRKFVYNSTEGAQLSSGKMTEITLSKWGIETNAFIPLPNTIEEDKFNLTEQELDVRYNSQDLPVFLMPVRLHEQVKGIVNFFKSIGSENSKKGLFLIAGEGPDRALISEFISSNELQDNVKLLGHCETDKLVSLYKKANVFLLASYTDASPLTLIEGLRMKLPVLVSERCGNHFEAVMPGGNGYLFDPYKPAEIKISFENLLARQRDWKDMGTLSNTLYEEHFGRDKVIVTFIRELTRFSTLKKVN